MDIYKENASSFLPKFEDNVDLKKNQEMGKWFVNSIALNINVARFLQFSGSSKKILTGIRSNLGSYFIFTSSIMTCCSSLMGSYNGVTAFEIA